MYAALVSHVKALRNSRSAEDAMEAVEGLTNAAWAIYLAKWGRR